jgi:hypothetical protein
MILSFRGFALMGVLTVCLASCAGEPGPRQAVETPAYGTDNPYGSSIPGRQYGPQDRAGNQMQNGLPPWSGCQHTTRC